MTGLDIRSVSQSTKDGRCLEVWFARGVTDNDRAALLRAVNRDSQFAAMVGALEELLPTIRSVDPETTAAIIKAREILASIKASTS